MRVNCEIDNLRITAHMGLGRLVAALRAEKKFPSREMAKRLHISRPTLYNYENGKSKMPMETFLSICAVLEVKIEQIQGGRS